MSDKTENKERSKNPLRTNINRKSSRTTNPLIVKDYSEFILMSSVKNIHISSQRSLETAVEMMFCHRQNLWQYNKQQFALQSTNQEQIQARLTKGEQTRMSMFLFPLARNERGNTRGQT